MRTLIGLMLIAASSAGLADVPQPPGPVDQNAVSVEQAQTTDAIVIDVNEGLELMGNSEQHDEPGAPVVSSSVTPAPVQATTEVREYDVPPVRKVNKSRHFRIISLNKPRVAEPVPADDVEQ